MRMVDIGHTNAKIWHNGKIERVQLDRFEPPKEPYYFICVNPSLLSRLQADPNGTNLAEMISLKSNYQGLGIDRQVVCKAIDEGVIVDAGSAVTVDVMESGLHQGGTILPGLEAFRQTFANISPNLIFDLDASVDLMRLPQSTHEALNFATFGSLKAVIENIRGDKKLYFCGGDGALLASLFEEAIVKEDLLFKGMLKVIRGE